MYEILHETPYLRRLAPTLEGSRPGSHVAALWAAIQDLGDTGRYEKWLDRIFRFVDRLVGAFESSRHFQILNRVDLTTLAVAPLPQRHGEARRELNDLAVRTHRLIERDTSEDAFLVNLDRRLAGIKVSDSNDFRPETGPSGGGEALVDVYCLRIVATNPAVEPEDADELISYLERQLSKARNA